MIDIARNINYYKPLTIIYNKIINNFLLLQIFNKLVYNFLI